MRRLKASCLPEVAGATGHLPTMTRSVAADYDVIELDPAARVADDNAAQNVARQVARPG
jgi:hypothetical protein